MAKGLLLALGMPKKGKPEVDVEEDDSEDMPAEHSEEQVEAAQSLVDAVKSGDAKAVVTAFKALSMVCEDEGDDEPPASGKY